MAEMDTRKLPVCGSGSSSAASRELPSVHLPCRGSRRPLPCFGKIFGFVSAWFHFGFWFCFALFWFCLFLLLLWFDFRLVLVWVCSVRFCPFLFLLCVVYLSYFMLPSSVRALACASVCACASGCLCVRIRYDLHLIPPQTADG